MNEEEKEVIEDMLGDETAPEAESEPIDAKAFSDVIRDYVRRGNITRIVVKRGGEAIVNLPLNAGIVGGIIGAVAAPWALITAAIATAGFDCTVELMKDDGETVDMSPRTFGRRFVDASVNAANDLRNMVDSFHTGAADEPYTEPEAEPAPDEEIPFEEHTEE